MDKFEKNSAELYDYFNSTKQYQNEVDIILKYFSKEPENAKLILDLGCGSGAHFQSFFDAGYSIHGVDISEDMLEKARKKYIHSYSDRLELTTEDLSNFSLGKNKYENVVSLYSVLGYITSLDSMIKLFSNVSSGLVPGGRFVFDVWDRDAVETIGPSDRIKTAPIGADVYSRSSKSCLDKDLKTVRVDFSYFKNGNLIGAEKPHFIKYFCETDIKLLAEMSKLKLVERIVYPHPDAFDKDGWSAVYVLEKLS